jgi:hypothetical protein
MLRNTLSGELVMESFPPRKILLGETSFLKPYVHCVGWKGNRFTTFSSNVRRLWMCGLCPGPKFKHVVEVHFLKCMEEELTQFNGLARRLWLRCNEVVHGSSLSSLQSLFQATTRAVGWIFQQDTLPRAVD